MVYTTERRWLIFVEYFQSFSARLFVDIMVSSSRATIFIPLLDVEYTHFCITADFLFSMSFDLVYLYFIPHFGVLICVNKFLTATSELILMEMMVPIYKMILHHALLLKRTTTKRTIIYRSCNCVAISYSCRDPVYGLYRTK
jgi:hypothetical protein